MARLLKSPIFWRMLLWSFLLALVPLAIVVIFMQREVGTSMDALRAQEVEKSALVLAAEVSSEPDQLQENVAHFSVGGQTVFILDGNGNYLAHTDPEKIGHPASADLSAAALRQILSGTDGTYQPPAAVDRRETVVEPVIGFAKIEARDAFVGIAVQGATSTSNYNQLLRRIFTQLIVGLIITSLIGGVGILTVINPLVKLSTFADRLGAGNLEERIGTEEMEGELKILANSLNTFAERVLQLIRTLEQRVAERTLDLQIASTVARQVSQVLDLKVLLPRLVELTTDSYDLYFTSVYLYDSTSRVLVFEAGTGEAGQKMKAEGKTYSIDAVPSLVAQAGRERRAVVLNDVSNSDVHLENPYLPDTRAEACIPMSVQDELVGVMSVQSEKVGHFSDANLQVLTMLAEQIGVAITNARLFEEQRQVANELRRVDEMKSQFLASMSHELRTPMNAIINFVEMVCSGLVGPVNDEQKELLEQSLQSSKHLLHLINDVLDISKIQAGRLTLFVEDNLNLYVELRAVMDMVIPLLQDKGSTLRLVEDIDDNLPLIPGDRRRIRQVLLNLLSNAIKFTEKGTVTLSVKNQGKKVVFAVIDTGPGIPKEAQELIFEPFVQAVDGIKQVEGTGLGLPISRSLVQAHGGKLWLESEPGEGAAFYFDLPSSRQ